MPILTEQDESDIMEFGINKDVDLIAVSYVRKQEDIESVRELIGGSASNIKIIAKIENQEALNNYDEILATADGIMICRSDLCTEIPPEKVFIAQKWMIEKANIASKPIITGSSMFDSMKSSKNPTQAEVTDVSNAVLDGTDAVMLGNSTANAKAPNNSVRAISRSCAEIERCIDYKRLFNDIKLFTPAPVSTSEALAASAVSTVQDMNIDMIIVVTETGHLGRLVAKYRPGVPVMACSKSSKTIKQLQLMRGLTAF